MVYTPIYYFLALKEKYLEPATSSHPIEAEGYEILLEVLMKIRTSICKTSKKFVPPT
jgi:hypothetical protein